MQCMHTSMKQGRLFVVCTHNTSDVTHTLGQVQAQILWPNPYPNA
jgi:hypothetical protein